MVKFQFLAQFPVGNISHPVFTSLSFFLCSFALFVYHVINRSIIVITYPALAILLRIMNFRCNIIGSYNAVLLCYKKKFSSSF